MHPDINKKIYPRLSTTLSTSSTTLATTLATTIITATTYLLSITTTAPVTTSSKLSSAPGSTTHRPKFRTMETYDLTDDDELLLSETEQPLTEKTGLLDID